MIHIALFPSPLTSPKTRPFRQRISEIRLFFTLSCHEPVIRLVAKPRLYEIDSSQIEETAYTVLLPLAGLSWTVQGMLSHSLGEKNMVLRLRGLVLFRPKSPLTQQQNPEDRVGPVCSAGPPPPTLAPQSGNE
jgi:hypothetical protein